MRFIRARSNILGPVCGLLVIGSGCSTAIEDTSQNAAPEQSNVANLGTPSRSDRAPAAENTKAEARGDEAPATAPPAGLYISEVAANFKGNAVSWIELVNTGTTAISLKDYKLRSGGRTANGTKKSSVTFTLPDKTIPAGGYLVIAGKASTFLKGASDSIYLLDANSYMPYWGASGFVELLEGGNTADFVRFGGDETAPTTAGAWPTSATDNVPVFVTPSNYGPSESIDPIDSYDQSIVRMSGAFTATKTKDDWTLVKFPTPGGKNDVAKDAVSSDNDGIPDSAKVEGGSFAGLNLYAMGARKGQRDLFIYVDYLTSDDPGITPRESSLTKVVSAFTGHGIHVHFDVGTLFANEFDTARYNLSGSSHALDYVKCTQLETSAVGAGCKNVYEYVSSSMTASRRAIFRYMLMGSSQLESGDGGSSGKAELPGNKFIVTMGNWGFKTDTEQRRLQLENDQASTIMHELGHTLSLRHGGFENRNQKPNYYSIMNYLYQLEGLPSNPRGMGPTERYYFRMNVYESRAVPGYPNANTYRRCDEPEGPCSAQFRMDYSDGSGQSLSENALREGAIIGRGRDGNAYGDWNLDGKAASSSYAQDVNLDGSRTAISDHDDWSSLILITGRSYTKPAAAQGSPKNQSARDEPFVMESLPPDTAPTLVHEEAPPASLLRQLAE
ncbi:lamin tail domain-containing protein [Pendulispora albinea]|uniref:Lamin tail domain-containing protein n=1 Tax=Pendulispora albinea TaxID=2741071 RepID=A0ABZ2LW45_9BACT